MVSRNITEPLLLIVVVLGLFVSADTSFYGHTYQKSASTVTASNAAAACASMTVNGQQGYLAVISSELEYNYILSQGFMTYSSTSSTSYQLWLNGNCLDANGIYKYISGPETGNVMYNVFFDKCSTWCPFSATEPNFYPNEYYVITDYDPLYNRFIFINLSDKTANSFYALCEFAPSSSYVSPMSDTVNTVTITNMNGFNMTAVSAVFTNIDTPSNTFTCANKSILSSTSISCQVPVDGTGRYSVSINDGTSRTDTFAPWQYPTPFVASVNMQTFTAGSIVTIIGSNFGANASVITVAFTPTNSTNPYTCTSVAFVTVPAGFGYQMLTCSLSITIPATIAVTPITMTVNKVKTIQYRLPFFYKNQYISGFPSLGNYSSINTVYTPQLKVDGQNGRLGNVPDQTSYNYYSQIMPQYTSPVANYFVYEPYFWNTSGYFWDNGPYKNTHVTAFGTTNGTTLQPNTSSRLIFQFGNQLLKLDDGTGIYGAVVFYGGIPPTFQSNLTTTVPTNGTVVNLLLNNFGTIFSTIIVTFRSQSLTFTKDYIESDINANIPIGYGGPYEISVQVDSVATPSKTQYIDYAYPSIDAADSAPTEGGQITISGGNFYNDVTLMSVQLNGKSCSGITFVKTYYQITCTLASGTGSNSMVLTVGGRNSNSFAYSYIPPTITSATDISPLGGNVTISGSNFGDNIANIQVTLSGTPVTCALLVNHTTLQCAFPSKQGNVSIAIAVSSLPSNTYTFSYLAPTITSVTQVQDYIQILGNNFGNNFAMLSVSIGTVSITATCTGNNTFVVCTPPWNTVSDYIYITGSSFDPAPYKFYFTPYISLISSTQFDTPGGMATITGRYFEKEAYGVGDNLVVVDNGFENNNTGYRSNLELDYTVLPGTGINLELYIRKDTNLKSNVITFSFNKPNITTITPSNSTYYMVGNNFGNDLSKVTVTIGSYKAVQLVMVTPHYQLSFQPQNQTINGDLVLNVNGQTVTYSPIKLQPFIESIELPPIQGSTVHLYGYYLSKTNDNGQSTNIQFYFNSVLTTCTQQSSPAPYVYTCPIPAGTGAIQAFIINDGIQSDMFSFSYQPPAINSTTTTIYNTAANITITGSNFANVLLKVFIGNTECTNPTLVSDTTIVCLFNGKESPYNGLLTVNVTVNGITGSNRIFDYYRLTIDSVYNEEDALYIVGNRIGPVSGLTITLGTVQIQSHCQGNDTFLVCSQLPISVQSGVLTIVDGVTIPPPNTTVDLVPWIASLDKSVFSTLGDQVTINGRFFESTSNGVDNVIYVVDRGVDQSNFTLVDNTTLIYIISSGTGKDYSLSLSISNRTSNMVTYSYKAPSITAYSQSAQTLSINGDSFGTVPSNVHVVYNNTQIQVDSVVDSTITLTLPNTLLNGLFSVDVSNQTSGSLSLYLTPSIDSVSPRPLTTGQAVTITGSFLSPTDVTGQDVGLAFNTQHDTLNCTYLSSSYPYKVVCQQPPGSNTIVYTASYDNGTSNSFPFTYQPPIISYTSSIFYQQIKQVTITGKSFTKTNLTVYIGNVLCSQPTWLDDTDISCLYDGSVAPPAVGKSLMVVVNASGLIGQNSVFLYSSEKSCPSNCSSNGACDVVSGTCSCLGGWIGFDCSIANNSSTPATPTPTTNPSATSTLSTAYSQSFNVLVAFLREQTPTGEVAKLYDVNKDFKWVETTTISQTSTYYKATYSNVSLEVTVTYYPSPTSVNFAGDNMPIQPNSLKYLVQVSGWQFADSKNVLQVIFDNTAPKTQSIGCDSSAQNVTTISRYGGEGAWYQLVSGSTELDAIFSDRVILDQTVVSNQLIILNSNDQLYSQLTSTDLYHLLAAVQVPSFTQSVTIDPNFATVSKYQEPCDDNIKSDDKNKNTWKIAVGVVVGVVGGLAVVLLIVYLMKRKLSSSSKLRSLNHTNNIDSHH